MDFNDYTYVIVPTVELTDNMIAESMNDVEHLRYSMDGSKVVLKFCSKFPNSCKGYPKYTHKEILIEMIKKEWAGDL